MEFRIKESVKILNRAGGYGLTVMDAHNLISRQAIRGSEVPFGQTRTRHLFSRENLLRAAIFLELHNFLPLKMARAATYGGPEDQMIKNGFAFVREIERFKENGRMKVFPHMLFGNTPESAVKAFRSSSAGLFINIAEIKNHMDVAIQDFTENQNS